MRVHLEFGKCYERQRGADLFRLVMVSGGADSCAALIQQLTEIDCQVHMHHVEFDNYENRLRAENEAVKHIVSYCRQHYRGFGFTSNVISFPNIGYTGYLQKDTIVMGFIAGNIARSIQVAIQKDTGRVKPVEVVFGAVKDDLRLQDREAYLTKDPKCVGRQMAFNSSFMDYEKDGKEIPRLIFPLLGTPKFEAYKLVPDELRAHLSSCRSPGYLSDGTAIACGVCGTCRQFQDI